MADEERNDARADAPEEADAFADEPRRERLYGGGEEKKERRGGLQRSSPKAITGWLGEPRLPFRTRILMRLPCEHPADAIPTYPSWIK